MDKENNYNKIINTAARAVFKKYNLFQKGQSRTWIDDNGWFLIVVEFQPSNWDKGSYLNVGINYLWQNEEYLSYDYGYRLNDFISYKNDDESFYSNIIYLAEKAIEKVMEYRKFNKVEFAKEQILNRNGYSSNCNELYNKMMICGLSKDNIALNYYKMLLKETECSEREYDKKYYKELIEYIMFVVNDSEQFYDYINKKILLQRKFWNSKSSMKKLNV